MSLIKGGCLNTVFTVAPDQTLVAFAPHDPFDLRKTTCPGIEIRGGKNRIGQRFLNGDESPAFGCIPIQQRAEVIRVDLVHVQKKDMADIATNGLLGKVLKVLCSFLHM